MPRQRCNHSRSHSYNNPSDNPAIVRREAHLGYFAVTIAVYVSARVVHLKGHLNPILLIPHAFLQTSDENIVIKEYPLFLQVPPRKKKGNPRKVTPWGKNKKKSHVEMTCHFSCRLARTNSQPPSRIRGFSPSVILFTWVLAAHEHDEQVRGRGRA
ncbi:MAG: hypothetical protein JOS17DRAFT_323905 [Linnemannia elongata]|nr:MAG: hypothetical protein JOS17DRAFT_323905 [Linnemannia elongata]